VEADFYSDSAVRKTLTAGNGERSGSPGSCDPRLRVLFDAARHAFSGRVTATPSSPGRPWRVRRRGRSTFKGTSCPRLSRDTPKYAFSLSSWLSRVSQAFDYFPHSLDNSRCPIKVDLLDCVLGGVVVRISERCGVGHHNSGISRWCRGGHLITSDFPQHLDRTIQQSLVNAPSPRSEPPCRPACGH
jgi:hypothetical protein